ncbi:family 16 glycosylhydrolase [Cellulomonas xiejunii]|uniref:family 16 glycosylhydrolase n=1 Tax=Cellulomonas xiejunii TaxID=2968083 RepID=UPI001D0E965B|nr:family 16 glycosylhydrolase [Cellulomonas xiejunii]MCC2314583.1 glycoside hydrolase family 16 protein [Cellulomonas xiejunii]
MNVLAALVLAALAPASGAAAGPVANAAPVAADVVTLVPWKSQWRWYYAAADPAGGAWQTRWYDDSRWRRGAAPLGWGDPQVATTLGPDGGTQPRSVQMRHAFDVGQPAALGAVRVEVVVDDGAVVYVNGTEVGRAQMPAGTIRRDTNATRSSPTRATFEVPLSVLREGRNVLAMSTHLNSRSTRAVVADATVVADSVSRPGSEAVVPFGSRWSYSVVQAGGVGPTGAVTTPTTWGTAVSGAAIPAEGQAGAQVVRFARDVTVENLRTVTAAVVRTLADDGVRVTVNGTEVGRANLTSGSLATTTRASTTYGGPVELNVPVGVLVEGRNRVEVEVRQNYRNSQQMSFDAAVWLGRGAAATPTPTRTVAPTQAATPRPSATPSPSPTTGTAAGSVLPYWGAPVFADEFNGSTLSASRWRVRDLTRLSFDEAVISRQAVGVADGRLRITTSRLDRPVEKDGRMRHYQTGYVDTIGLFSQRYGRWEMRAKLPLTERASRGVWPAFWLRDSSGLGEIDIMEAIGSPHDQEYVVPPGAWAATVHQSTNHEDGTERITKTVTNMGSVVGGYHTWALEWTPQEMRFYYDGKLAWTATTADHPWFRTAFTANGVNIRINTQVGHEWMGYTDLSRPELTTLPATYEIDYVRAWRYPG